MTDKCQRCGVEDPDCRTLWMSCMYAMNELGLPFDHIAIHGIRLDKVGEEMLPTFKLKVPKFETVEEASKTRTPTDIQFFTLRVCKDCRSEWMGYITSWFDSKKPASCGSGIFIRRHGASVEVTEEEWEALNPGREPVRFLQEEDKCTCPVNANEYCPSCQKKMGKDRLKP